MQNIILIGMAGCGKSTVGVLLAKTLGYEFIDTDLVIQRREGRLLQDILNTDGIGYFKEVEERALLSIDAHHAVIATGGSAVYSERGMASLKRGGICVFLKLPFDEITRRINNIATRGIAIAQGMTLQDVFEERAPLYEKYADIVIECEGDAEANVAAVLNALKEVRSVPNE